MNKMAEYLSQYKDVFLSEAKEHIEAMNKSLLKLEKAPAKLELINAIFHASHTLKSMASTMDYDRTATLCHALEDVLDSIKKKKIKLDKAADILFECFDALELNLKELRKGKDELDTDYLVEKLHRLVKTEKTDESGVSSEISSLSEDAISAEPAVAKIQSIEVKVEKLDLLMNLAEELLINKMSLDRVKESVEIPELTAAVDTLGRIVTDIQYNVMQARMVPIGFVFNRFPRMVRDLAKQQKKEVSLQMKGTDIELDRAVIDEIGESLVHLLRNAVDHGIERPEERKKAGKPPQGTIRLTATRNKGFAVIEAADDGAGFDLEDIKKMAVKRGILSQRATKEDVMNSLFSGVSTKKEVTAVSGRGYGLNIVKKKVESLGGAVKVESDQKVGTKFVIEIPLTLAIIKALFVEVGGRSYAIPLASIERLVFVNEKDIKGMLNHEAIILNEENIPITRLNVLFDAQPLSVDKLPIVIVRKKKEKLGLVVDSLMSTQEIVIKPLNRLVRENRYFAGSTIIGSGEVVLILDVTNLFLSQKIETADDAEKLAVSAN